MNFANAVCKIEVNGEDRTVPRFTLSWSHYLFLMRMEEAQRRFYDHLQEFMLELGKGFLYAGRQVRITDNEDHYYIDLVFYNRLLRSFVLVDLKTGKLKHQDVGQMQMYVNYYDRVVKLPEENPTIGILLCGDKSDFVVKVPRSA